MNQLFENSTVLSGEQRIISLSRRRYIAFPCVDSESYSIR